MEHVHRISVSGHAQSSGDQINVQRVGCLSPFSQRFIYSVFTKDTSDEKGQARDTKVHVTL